MADAPESPYLYTLFARRNTDDPARPAACPGDRLDLNQFTRATIAVEAFLWAIEWKTTWTGGHGWHPPQPDLSWELYQYPFDNPGGGRRVAVHHDELMPATIAPPLWEDLPGRTPIAAQSLLGDWHTTHTRLVGQPAARVPTHFHITDKAAATAPSTEEITHG